MGGYLTVETPDAMDSNVLVWIRNSDSFDSIIDVLAQAISLKDNDLAEWLRKGKTDSEFAYEFFGMLDLSQLTQTQFLHFVEATDRGMEIMIEQMHRAEREDLEWQLTSLAVLRALLWNHSLIAHKYNGIKHIVCGEVEIQMPEWLLKTTYEVLSAHAWPIHASLSVQLWQRSKSLPTDLMEFHAGFTDKVLRPYRIECITVAAWISRLIVEPARTNRIYYQIAVAIMFFGSTAW